MPLSTHHNFSALMPHGSKIRSNCRNTPIPNADVSSENLKIFETISANLNLFDNFWLGGGTTLDPIGPQVSPV